MTLRITAAAIVLFSFSPVCVWQAEAANEAAMCNAAKSMADDQQTFFDEAKGEKLSDGKWKGKGNGQNCAVEDHGDGGDKNFTCYFQAAGHKGSLDFISGFESALGACLRNAGYLKEPVNFAEDDGATTFGNSWKKHGSDGAEYALDSLVTEGADKFSAIIRFSYQPDP